MGVNGRGRLEGKVAIITGAGRGIGAATARLFAREGAKVVIAELDPALGDETLAAIREASGTAIAVKTDVSSEADVRAMIDAAVAEYGGLDILVNNAGYGDGKTVEEASAEEWDSMMRVNARGVFLAVKYALPRMRARGGGAIVNIASMFAVNASAGYAVYHATKGAIRQLTKSMALSYAAEGIRCNAIHPGPTSTPGSDTPAARALLGDKVTPMGRWGDPEDIAYGCLYLASDEAKFVTGIDLLIDGGSTS